MKVERKYFVGERKYFVGERKNGVEVESFIPFFQIDFSSQDRGIPRANSEM